MEKNEWLVQRYARIVRELRAELQDSQWERDRLRTSEIMLKGSVRAYLRQHSEDIIPAHAKVPCKCGYCKCGPGRSGGIMSEWESAEMGTVTYAVLFDDRKLHWWERLWNWLRRRKRLIAYWNLEVPDWVE